MGSEVQGKSELEERNITPLASVLAMLYRVNVKIFAFHNLFLIFMINYYADVMMRITMLIWSTFTGPQF